MQTLVSHICMPKKNKVTVHKISAEVMITVETVGMTSIYTDGLLKGRTPEIHIQISRHVRRDGNR